MKRLALLLFPALLAAQPRRPSGPIAGIALCASRAWITTRDTIVMSFALHDPKTHQPIATPIPQWGVSDTLLARVTATGVVHAQRAGTVIVTAVTPDPWRPGSRIMAQFPVTIGPYPPAPLTDAQKRRLRSEQNCLRRGVIGLGG